MAKTKTSPADDLEADFLKMFGSNDEQATVTQFLDSGYAPFNFALSNRYDGGFPVGRITELAGPPSSGKTALATYAMIAAQRMGGVAAFMDHERSFDEKLAVKLGLNPAAGRYIYRKPRTFEESLALCIQVAKWLRTNKKIAPDAPICWIFDSLASQVPMSVLFDKDGKERGLDSRNMNDNTALSRATSSAMPAFAQYVEELGICAIFLNQVRTKIGVMYGDPRTTPGGDAPKFYASVRIMLNAGSKITKKGEDTPLGMQISATVIKNKVSRPFLKSEWRFGFQPDGTGKFEVARSLLDFLVKNKIMAVDTQGRVEWEGGKPHREALCKKLEESGEIDKLLRLLPGGYEGEIDESAAASADLASVEEAA